MKDPPLGVKDKAVKVGAVCVCVWGGGGGGCSFTIAWTVFTSGTVYFLLWTQPIQTLISLEHTISYRMDTYRFNVYIAVGTMY